MSRNALRAGFLLTLAGCFAAPALAQQYPVKAIRIVAPYPAGGSSDTIARMMSAKLTEAWGQPAVVDNRGGVGGSLGTEIVAKSPDFSQGHYRLGEIMLMRGDTPGAIKHLSTFVSHAPTGPEAARWVAHAESTLEQLRAPASDGGAAPAGE